MDKVRESQDDLRRCILERRDRGRRPEDAVDVIDVTDVIDDLRGIAGRLRVGCCSSSL